MMHTKYNIHAHSFSASPDMHDISSYSFITSLRGDLVVYSRLVFNGSFLVPPLVKTAWRLQEIRNLAQCMKIIKCSQFCRLAYLWVIFKHSATLFSQYWMQKGYTQGGRTEDLEPPGLTYIGGSIIGKLFYPNYIRVRTSIVLVNYIGQLES